MTKAWFVLQRQELKQLLMLPELCADHLVRPPHHRANLLTQVRSGEYKGVWDGVGAEQGYFGAAARNVVDEAPQLRVLIHRDTTLLVHAAPRLRSTFFYVGHLCALWISDLSVERRNIPRKQTIKLSASEGCHRPVMRQLSAGFTEANAYRDDAIGVSGGRPLPVRTIPIGRIKDNALVRRAEAIRNRITQGACHG